MSYWIDEYTTRLNFIHWEDEYLYRVLNKRFFSIMHLIKSATQIYNLSLNIIFYISLSTFDKVTCAGIQFPNGGAKREFFSSRRGTQHLALGMITRRGDEILWLQEAIRREQKRPLWGAARDEHADVDDVGPVRPCSTQIDAEGPTAGGRVGRRSFHLHRHTETARRSDPRNKARHHSSYQIYNRNFGINN